MVALLGAISPLALVNCVLTRICSQFEYVIDFISYKAENFAGGIGEQGGCGDQPFQDMTAKMGHDFSGAQVLVVGASRGGIGAAIARAFRDAGALVLITGAEPAPDPDDGFDYTQLDVTDTQAVRAFAASIAQLDVLVNCAAITRRGEEMDPEFFAHVLDVNLVGSLRCAEALHGALKGGSVINIASMYARFGSPRNPAYGASKAGVEQMTKSLAMAWAPDNIRVNAVAPGFIVTEQSARARQDPEFTKAIEVRTPMGRWGEPVDIAGITLFLASEDAAFITGTTIPVDGGYSVA